MKLWFSERTMQCCHWKKYTKKNKHTLPLPILHCSSTPSTRLPLRPLYPIPLPAGEIKDDKKIHSLTFLPSLTVHLCPFGSLPLSPSTQLFPKPLPPTTNLLPCPESWCEQTRRSREEHCQCFLGDKLQKLAYTIQSVSHTVHDPPQSPGNRNHMIFTCR